MGPRIVRAKVRIARATDAVSLAEFFQRAWTEAGPDALGFTGATNKAIKEIASEDFLIQRITNPKNNILIAERNGRVLGFASLRTMGRGKGELSGIVILKSESGKGLGTKLLERASKSAARLGVKRLIVKTEVFNERAIAFYKKNGFAETRKENESWQKTGASSGPGEETENYYNSGSLSSTAGSIERDSRRDTDARYGLTLIGDIARLLRPSFVLPDEAREYFRAHRSPRQQS